MLGEYHRGQRDSTLSENGLSRTLPVVSAMADPPHGYYV
jgi:hypothetical protein